MFIVVFLLLFATSSTSHVRHSEELLGPLPSLKVPNDEFGRAARRGKVDVLGLVLKKRIAQLRQAGQTELVFLVDSSASVGSENFYNEIKFIRKVRKFSRTPMHIQIWEEKLGHLLVCEFQTAIFSQFLIIGRSARTAIEFGLYISFFWLSFAVNITQFQQNIFTFYVFINQQVSQSF